MSSIKIIERINPDLAELLPRFFKESRGDLVKMQDAFDVEDFDTLDRLGHTVKGTSYGYGFKGMGDIAHAIQMAARARDLDAGRDHIARLYLYLDEVQVELAEE